MTAEAAVAVVREFAKRVQEQGIPVQQAILFGSHARGAATSVSDIDACIVSPSPRPRSEFADFTPLERLA